MNHQSTAEVITLKHTSEWLEELVTIQNSFWFSSLGLGLGIWISTEFPGDADTAGLGTRPWEWLRALTLTHGIRLAAWALPKSLSEVRDLRPHPRHKESEYAF